MAPSSILALPLLVAFALSGCSDSGSDGGGGAGVAEVAIHEFAYHPGSVTVGVDGVVRFANHDTATHTATADDGSWTTGDIATGTSADVRFEEAGTFRYHCARHPSMHGSLTVAA